VNKVNQSKSANEKEKHLYPAIKKALSDYLRRPDEDFSLTLEETANGFPDNVQAFLPNHIFVLGAHKEIRPDLTGRIGPGGVCAGLYGHVEFLLTAEVKDGSPTISDVFQAKSYGELYDAVALLVCTRLPEERLHRVLGEHPELLNYGSRRRLYICQFSQDEHAIINWVENREPRKPLI